MKVDPEKWLTFNTNANKIIALVKEMKNDYEFVDEEIDCCLDKIEGLSWVIRLRHRHNIALTTIEEKTNE